jgi:23S rRNA (pseudouridine1915-N3)-methyltransferase
MRITILSISSKQPGWLTEGVEEFAKRLAGKVRLELIELKAESRSGGRSIEKILETEAERVRSRLPKPCLCLALDERGAQKSTRDFANAMDGWKQNGTHAAFVIGGPDGLEPGFKKSADQLWALSRLTLPHGLARLVLVEQIYRASSLLDGHPYHRE